MGFIDGRILDGATTIVKQLTKSGYIAYFAGGFARDKLLNLPSYDIDIATNASVEEITKLFKKCYHVGAGFGVVQVVINANSYEVASFRQDSVYIDGRRPSNVQPASAKMDALRRDFTINGMFYDPVSEQIIDYVNGKQDLQDKMIRAIGDPNQRFEEDRLRMLRAIRFSIRFGFAIEQNTYQAICKWANQLFPSVSMERVLDELKKMAQSPHFDQALKLLQSSSLLSIIFSQIPANEWQIQQIKALSMHIPLAIKLCVALIYVEWSKKIELLRYLKMSNEEIKLAELFEKISIVFTAPVMDKPTLCRLLAMKHSKICVEAYLEIHQEKRSTITKCIEELQPFIQRLAHKNPLITSQDLRNLGITDGPLMGQLLVEAENIAINENSQDVFLIIEKLMKSKIWPF